MTRKFVLFPVYDFGLDIMMRHLICDRDGHKWIPYDTSSTSTHVCGHCGDKCYGDDVALELNVDHYHDGEAIHQWRATQCQLLGHDWNKTVSGEICPGIGICKRCAIQSKDGK